MITRDAFIKGKSLIGSILRKTERLHAKRQKFILHILILFLSHRGRINFLQMGRQGGKNEKNYRYHFENRYDWLAFNTVYIEKNCSNEIVIGFDPSYISKSGKCSHGLALCKEDIKILSNNKGVAPNGALLLTPLKLLQRFRSSGAIN